MKDSTIPRLFGGSLIDYVEVRLLLGVVLNSYSFVHITVVAEAYYLIHVCMYGMWFKLLAQTDEFLGFLHPSAG